MFAGIVETAPPTVNISNSNIVELSAGVGCKVYVQSKAGEWELFRTVFADLLIDGFISLTPSQKGYKLQCKSYVRRSILKKMVILNGDEVVDDKKETENVNRFINMSMAKLKYYFNVEIYEKNFKLPQLNQ